jgi:DNA-binding CsgD family transcriptional regulator
MNIKSKIQINPSYEWDEEAKTLNISHRELEVFALLEDGHNNKEIAQILGIQYQSVKNHWHNLSKKLKVKNLGQAIVFLMFTNVIKIEVTSPVKAQLTKKDSIEGIRKLTQDEDPYHTLSNREKKQSKKFLLDHGLYKKMYEHRRNELNEP